MRVLELLSPSVPGGALAQFALAAALSASEFGRVIRASFQITTAESFAFPQRAFVRLTLSVPLNQVAVHVVGGLLGPVGATQVCASIGAPMSDSLQRVASGAGFEAMLLTASSVERMSMPIGLMMFQAAATLTMGGSPSLSDTVIRGACVVVYGTADEVLRLG